MTGIYLYARAPPPPPPAAGIELDASAWKRGRLSPAERRHWDECGYLIIKDALPAAHHAALLSAVDTCREAALSSGQNEPSEMTHAAAFSRCDGSAFQLDPAVSRLLTNERVLPKVVDILGA